MLLTDKIIVVLGGSSGIGLATAKAARAEGALVTITGRSRERLTKACADAGEGLQAVVLDAADETGTRGFFQDLSHVDHLFITAGTVISDSRLAQDSERMRPTMDTRFWGALYAAKYAAPRMHGSGSITFMSGTAARRPLAGASVATG